MACEHCEPSHHRTARLYRIDAHLTGARLALDSGCTVRGIFKLGIANKLIGNFMDRFGAGDSAVDPRLNEVGELMGRYVAKIAKWKGLAE